MTGPNPAGQLSPYRHGLTAPDTRATSQARGGFVRRHKLAREAAEALIRAINDLDGLDRDGYLDVAVDRLDMRLADLVRSVAAMREAMADVVALDAQLRARATAPARADGPTAEEFGAHLLHTLAAAVGMSADDLAAPCLDKPASPD